MNIKNFGACPANDAVSTYSVPWIISRRCTSCDLFMRIQSTKYFSRFVVLKYKFNPVALRKGSSVVERRPRCRRTGCNPRRCIYFACAKYGDMALLRSNGLVLRGLTNGRLVQSNAFWSRYLTCLPNDHSSSDPDMYNCRSNFLCVRQSILR